MKILMGLIALYAAGTATYLLVTREDASTAPAAPVVFEQPSDAEARRIKNEARHFVNEELKSFVTEIEQRIAALRSLHEDMGTELARAKDVAEGAGKEGVAAITALQGRLKELEEKDDLTVRLAKLEKSLTPLRKRIVALEKRPVVREVVARGPDKNKPRDPPRPKLPEAEKPDPAAIRAAVAKAMSQLASDDLEIVVLGIEGARKHGIREALPRLIEILKTSKHVFARTSAAAALGDLKDCDAVFALADAFVDSSPMVAQQAHRAIRQITGFDSGISATARIRERRKAKGAVVQWWRANEAKVRARLNQTKPDAG